ncbi:hypothetical protein Ahy_A04g017315 [Arachis hypogaea]|uniref:F-box associated domain-containing protein n=1 Tax=Arachis hypogaea TaxID=3818 RepID=A0A445DAN9_ARAHY|nr:hypothetical protein Ahy_A04g017315 [Arachis hypogaea]
MGRPGRFVILGGCLAFYSHDYFGHKTDIWVMKEYKVQSSWTLYAIPGLEFDPLCLSNGSDIIGVDPFGVSIPVGSIKLVKYNIREELLQHFTCPHHLGHHAYNFASCSYTESPWCSLVIVSIRIRRRILSIK